MSQDIPIILVFDQTVILKGRQKDWSKYNTLASCYFPQVVLEELEFLSKRGVLPEEEKTAREFVAFFPNSDWKIHKGMSSHDALQLDEGANLSKNARLQNSIARSVYNLSVHNFKKLVVLVSNSQNLRQNLTNIDAKNLVSLTLPQFKQWLNTGEIPAVVVETSNNISSHSNTPIVDTDTSEISPEVTRVRKKHKRQSSVKSHSSSRKRKKRKSSKVSVVSNFVTTIFLLGILTVTGMLVWLVINPTSFEQFWQKKSLPLLSQDSLNS